MQINWLKFVRWYLDKTIKLCRLNPTGGHHDNPQFGPSIKFAHLPLWSRLIELFYLYFALKLFVCLILQHNYNLLTQALSASNNNNINLLQKNGTGIQASIEYISERAIKQTELEVTMARLDLIGNPFYEFGFAVEPLLLYLLFIIYLIYAQTRLFIALKGPIALGFLQMLLDPERERALVTEQQINLQVVQFVQSSKNFLLVNRKRISLAAVEANHLCQNRDKHLRWLNGQFFKLECAHERAMSEIFELAQMGKLEPFSRQHERVAHMARVYGACVLFCQCSGLLFVLTTLLVVPWSGVLKLKPHREFAHLLFQIELILHALIGVQQLTFYLVNGFMCAYEQLVSVGQLAQMVTNLTDDTCSITNTCERQQVGRLKFREADSMRDVMVNFGKIESSLTSVESTKRKLPVANDGRLNKRLINLLIQYKLFLIQMRISQPPLGFIGAHITILMLAVPILNRVYVAYLPTEIRWVLLANALVIIISCDCLVMPNCMLYAQCLNLFRSMSSLLTHIDAHRAHSSQHHELLTYDEHTVSLLRREQNLPDLALRRFATDAHLLWLTYSGFIGIHFWCGLLLAPMFLRDTARLGASGNLLTDTLEIF